MALTELEIRKAQPKAKTYRLTDSEGLHLAISSSGGKLWRWRYYYQGKQQILALGKYPSVTLAEARKQRDEGKLLLAAGKHPAREKRAAKLRKAVETDNTFETIARQWIATKKPVMDEKSFNQNIARLEQHAFPLIGEIPITEITIPDTVRVIEKIAERGTIEMAKRVKQLMSQIFRYAAQRGICTFNPAADLKGVLPPTHERHHACIHPSKLPELLIAMENSNSDLAKYAMQLLALTFVRTGELIAARWDEINWKDKEWHIPKERMKMKRSHIVPLSKQSIAILKQLKDRTGHKSHIFYSAASKHKHISNGAVLMSLRRMGYRNKMTGHGFRTLASTILNEHSYSPDVIEKQLAHEDRNKIRAAYNRAEYLPERKKMMQEYANYLEKCCSKK